MMFGMADPSQNDAFFSIIVNRGRGVKLGKKENLETEVSRFWQREKDSNYGFYENGVKIRAKHYSLFGKCRIFVTSGKRVYNRMMRVKGKT